MDDLDTSLTPTPAVLVEPRSAAPPTTIPADAILSQLETILQSDAFRRSGRLRSLLRYIVEQTARSPERRLDETALRSVLFAERNGSQFESSARIRVEAHRLREKLVEYYAAEGRQDPILITLTDRGYRAVIRDRRSPRRDSAPDAAKSILVTRFTNLARTPKSKRFARGLMPELLHALTQRRGLRVVPAAGWSAERVRGAVARAEVDAVLEATIRSHGKSLRTHVQLTGTADGSILWSQVFERSSPDPAIQHQLASSVSHRVSATLVGERATGLNPATSNNQAHLLYLRGCHHSDRRTREALKKSIDCFEQALKLAPYYALPYAGLAQAYPLIALCGESPVLGTMALAKAAALRCLEIDPGNPEGHIGVGMAAAYADWDLNRAQTEFRLAIEADATNIHAREYYACGCLLPTARFEEAVTQMRRAVELSPFSLTAHNALGWALHFAGRAEEGLAHLQQTLDLEPHFYLTHWSLGLLYEHLGSAERAVAAYQKAESLSDSIPFVLGALGHAYGVFGMRQRAEIMLGKLLQLTHDGQATAPDVALLHIGLADTRSALEWLEKAANERCPGLLWLGIDARWRPLQRAQTFQSVLRRIGWPWRAAKGAFI